MRVEDLFNLNDNESRYQVSHRPQEIGPTWLLGVLEKIARFEKLENSSIVLQNNLAFMGRIEKASSSVFPLQDLWVSSTKQDIYSVFH